MAVVIRQLYTVQTRCRPGDMKRDKFCIVWKDLSCLLIDCQRTNMFMPNCDIVIQWKRQWSTRANKDKLVQHMKGMHRNQAT